MISLSKENGNAYGQILYQLFQGIGREIPLGARMPSARRLAAESGFSRNTISAAFRKLQDQGYLSVTKSGAVHVLEGESEILFRRTAASNAYFKLKKLVAGLKGDSSVVNRIAQVSPTLKFPIYFCSDTREEAWGTSRYLAREIGAQIEPFYVGHQELPHERAFYLCHPGSLLPTVEALRPLNIKPFMLKLEKSFISEFVRLAEDGGVLFLLSEKFKENLTTIAFSAHPLSGKSIFSASIAERDRVINLSKSVRHVVSLAVEPDSVLELGLVEKFRGEIKYIDPASIEESMVVYNFGYF